MKVIHNIKLSDTVHDILNDLRRYNIDAMPFFRAVKKHSICVIDTDELKDALIAGKKLIKNKTYYYIEFNKYILIYKQQDKHKILNAVHSHTTRIVSTFCYGDYDNCPDGGCNLCD